MILLWTGDGAKVIPRVEKEIDKDSPKAIIVGDVVLAPGYNFVPDADWAQARDTAKADIDKARIVEEWVKAEKSKDAAKPLISTEIEGELMVPATLGDIKRPTVIKVVKETYHVPTLQKWIDEELRQDVRLEIYNRIEEITKKAKG